MAKVEYRDDAADTFRVAKGSGGALNVRTVGGAVADDGNTIDVDGAQTFVYDGETLDYIEVESGGNTYRQTFTWDTGKLVGVSAWELQE